MFRVYSFLSVIITFFYSIVTFFHYNDDFGWEIFFYDQLTNITFISLIILFVFKAQIRWQKTWITRKIEGYQITSQGWKKAIINEAMSIFVIIFVGVMLSFFYYDTNAIPIILAAYTIESILSVFLGKKNYKLVIKPKLILVIANKQKMYYWKDIKSFVKRHDGVIIQLKNGIHNHIKDNDFIDSEVWQKTLKSTAIEKNIYWE